MAGHRWRSGLAAFAAAWPLAVGTLSCGGGGDDVADDELIVLSEYRYEVKGIEGGLSVTFEGVTLELDPDPARGPGVVGRYFPPSEEVRIDVGSLMEVLDPGSAAFGDFDAVVVQEFVIPADSPPVAGALDVEWGEDTVRVAVVAGGVEISLNGGAATFFDWDTFDDLLDAGGMAPEHVLVGALGMGAYEALYELMDIVVDSFEKIDEALEVANPIGYMGSGFAPTWTAPAGVTDPGYLDFGWVDENGSGFLDPGDAFSILFVDFWEYDPFEDYLDFRRGMIDLRGYTEVADAAERLVRIGYEPGSNPGGVTFNDYRMGEVWFDGGQGEMEITAVWNGTISVVFFE